MTCDACGRDFRVRRGLTCPWCGYNNGAGQAPRTEESVRDAEERRREQEEWGLDLGEYLDLEPD